MKTNLKRAIAIAVAIVMLAALFGCGTTAQKPEASTAGQTDKATEAASSESTEAVKEPVTITWFGGAFAQQLLKGIPDDQVNTELYKRTGVTVDHTPSMGVTDQPQKLAIMLAGGDLPDVITVGNPDLASKVITAKVAIPLEKLLETNGPDIKKNSASALGMSKLLNSDETNALYFIPGDVNGSDFNTNNMNNGWYLRWDLYKKLGFPKLETYDDFLSILSEMQKLEPTNKDGKKNYGLGLFLAESWGTYMVDKPYANYQGMLVLNTVVAQINVMTDKVVSRLTDPGSTYWQAMKFYNKAVQMGLMDPESVTLKYSTFTEKSKTGRYFSSPVAWTLGGANEQFIQDGTPEKGYVPMLFGNNKEAIYVGTINDGGNQYLTCITKDCKTPERVVDLINYLSTPEGVTLQRFGIEGTDYTVKDGGIVINPDVLKAMTSDPDFNKKTGINFTYNMFFLNPAGLKDSKGTDIDGNNNPVNMSKENLSAVSKEFVEHYSYNFVTEAFAKVPVYRYKYSLPTKLKTEAGSDLNANEGKLNAFISANEAKIMFSKNDTDFEKAKEKFINDIKAMGADDLVKYYSDQYEAMKVKVASLSK